MSQAELGKKSSAKWSVKLVLMTGVVVIFTIPIALLLAAPRSVHPTAEFVLLVVAPGLWNSVSTWITVPCWYVLLNIVLVTLAFISRAPPTPNDDRSHNSGIVGAETEVTENKPDADVNHNNIIDPPNLAGPVGNNFSPVESPVELQKPAAALVVERRSRSFKDLNAILTPVVALYPKKSLLRRSTTKVSSLSKESPESREMTITASCTLAAPKTSSPQLVVFEISTDMGNEAHLSDEVVMVEGAEESNKLHVEEEGLPLSAEELYVKAESFIGDFYRQLKMQRENSWNSLCGIYRRSC